MRARMQRRDRFGRFAEMGGGFSFNFKFSSGSSGPAAGRVVGQSGEDLIEVEMRGVKGVPDGIYSAPSGKGTAVKAVLNIEGTNVKTENLKQTITEEDAIDINSLKVAAQPSGWTPKETAPGEPNEWSSEDGLIVRQFADTYVAYDSDSAGNPVNEIARGESWADIQKATADYEKGNVTSMPAPSSKQEKIDKPFSPAPETAQSTDKLPNNSVSLEKEASMSFVTSDYDLEKAKAELENPVNAAIGQVWNIGGKKIHFGMEKDRNVVKYGEDMDDVEIVPINPYKIAGIEMDSEEGRELALKWAYARSALSSNDGTGYKSTSEVDALLYAGARGDEASSARLEELAEIGKQKVEKIRSERQAALRDIKPQSETNLRERIAKGLVSEEDQKAAERILDGSIDDLYVVHQTEYAFPIDDEGNIALKPASAYPTTLEDGREIFVPRHTIHAALNHVVDPIKERGWPPNSHIAIIPLRALLEANPGSIDNILAEDTFFTPEAGGVLKFPAGSYKTVSNVADIVSAREQVSEAIRELSKTGSYGAREDGIEPIIFEKGIMEISNTDARKSAFNALLQKISVDLGITNQIHMGTNPSRLDRAGDQDSQVSQNIEQFFTPDFLSNSSRNQIMRLAVGRDHSLYSAESQDSRASQVRQSVT
jgi:hypothetical protein